MISKVAVFHRGGAVLWRSDNENTEMDSGSTLDASTDTPSNYNSSSSSYLAINKLIQTVLLSDKTASDSLVHDSFTLKWTFSNNLDLVFVAIYFSFQKLLYIDDYLETVKQKFIEMFQDTLTGGISNLTQQDYSAFYVQYKRIQKFYKTQYKSQKKPKKWNQTEKGQKHQQFKYDKHKKPSHSHNNKDDDDDAPTTKSARKSVGKFKKKGALKSNGPRAFDPNKRKNTKKKKKNGKNKEHWSANNVLAFKKKKVSQSEMDSLNMALDEHEDTVNTGGEDTSIWTPQGAADLESSDDSSDDYDDYSDLSVPNRAKTETNSAGITGGIWSRFSKLIGNKPLEESDIVPVLQDLENSLSSKNVANVIAKQLCDSMKNQLIGKEIGTFNTIRSVVKTAMTDSLERILTPTRPINILHGIKNAQAENRPYTIVFIGVNGVGKSTSLSKVIYYLKSRNLKVSVAACDTFRAGAVEQLKTHCRALKVRLFSQGYARDAGAVAHRAIQDAKTQKDDVVLIDTAGRMQNNAPLMRSLQSLIQRNKPDLTLFVGEALVGNDGVDQLMEFNKALQVNRNSHVVDGIILTKFDTVDDKVGAAISMTYKSRKPIIFIGTGQNYQDLKRMHVRTLINKLLQ
eukprot:515294_1